MRLFGKRMLAAGLALLLAGPAFAQSSGSPQGQPAPGSPPATTGGQPNRGGQANPAARPNFNFPSPLYQNPDIRRSLNLTEQQLNQLNTDVTKLQGTFRDD